MKKLYAVIMAGGVGSRFWPRSREKTPKQLLNIIGEGTMIENTLARISTLVEPANTFVVVNKNQHEAVLKRLSSFPKENILVEPVGRNTAPCVALAASWIHRTDPEAVMIVLPADHLVQKQEEFIRVLSTATTVADETDALLTIGIQPNRPETGYGYIQFSDDGAANPYVAQGVYRVKTFAEKPNLETAQRFIKSGDFLWNSGMFVWKVKTILREVRAHLPELYEQIQSLAKTIGTPHYKQTLENTYGLIRGISIDYGVMEKAGNVYVMKGDFGWSDVGSWDEVANLTPKDPEQNSVKGTVVVNGAKGNYIDAGGKLVAAVGVENLIVVVTDDAVLVCRKGHSQDVKEVVDFIRRKQMSEYL
ncbi:MAG: NTP transferase domain-containing protein [Ignavibacteriae bacterium]|nr:NTP transferase domain-containing protein [Ignavibacteriota bacterium]